VADDLSIRRKLMAELHDKLWGLRNVIVSDGVVHFWVQSPATKNAKRCGSPPRAFLASVVLRTIHGTLNLCVLTGTKDFSF